MNKIYKVHNLKDYATKHRLLNIYNYSQYKLPTSKNVYYKEIRWGQIKIEIDCQTGIISAYKRGRDYLRRWIPTKVRWRWIKEIKNLIYPENIVEAIIL